MPMIQDKRAKEVGKKGAKGQVKWPGKGIYKGNIRIAQWGIKG
jgi:hypothetical protein